MGLDVVRIAGWERYGWLRHGFSTRAGGVSSVYRAGTRDGADLNLGWTREDAVGAVAENRLRFTAAVAQSAAMKLVTVRQVHGTEVRLVEAEALDGALETAEGKAVLEGDGLMTREGGVLLGVQSADCVPVLVVDVKRRVVAAIHAGWRGTVAGIVEQGVAAMRSEYGSQAEDLIAAVGPSIGPCCYEVGDSVREEFQRAFGYGSELFAGMRLDLWEANQRQLLSAGLGKDRIAVVKECTACTRDARGARRYFSHRAEQGSTGRMLSVVGVV